MKRLLLALALVAGPAAAQTVAITNARIATGLGTEIERGILVLRNGRVAEVGAAAPPPGAQVIDARGGWVTPGIFAGFSRLGIVEVDAVDQTDDSRATRGKLSAALDVAPAVNAANVNLAVNRIAGVTRAAVAPSAGNDVFAGQGAVVGLGAGADPVTRARLFQYVEVGERGARLAGGSRPAAYAELREALREARDLPAGSRFGVAGVRDSRRERADILALKPVVRGEQLLLVHAGRAQDILSVLDLRREFPALRLVLVGAEEGWRVAPQIAAARVPVIAMPLPNLPERFEVLGATQSNVGRLVAAGVTVALGVIDDDDARQLRLLPQAAGNLVALTKIPGAAGLTHAQAVRAITSAPADVFGLATHGRLAPGAVADVVLWSGDPLELSSRPQSVWIDGKPQPMTSRQTELRDRYLGLNPGDMTLQYKRP